MIGFGYDIHQLVRDSVLVLGGVVISNDIGTVAHSDGDVLIHSIIDALLGAAALGDIGEHFPDTDPQYKNVSSVELLKTINTLILQHNLSIINIDATIVIEKPKLTEYKKLIKENLANILNLSLSQINIKAKTNEKQDSVGNQNSVIVYSACQLKKIE